MLRPGEMQNLTIFVDNHASRVSLINIGPDFCQSLAHIISLLPHWYYLSQLKVLSLHNLHEDVCYL